MGYVALYSPHSFTWQNEQTLNECAQEKSMPFFSNSFALKCDFLQQFKGKSSSPPPSVVVVFYQLFYARCYGRYYYWCCILFIIFFSLKIQKSKRVWKQNKTKMEERKEKKILCVCIMFRFVALLSHAQILIRFAKKTRASGKQSGSQIFPFAWQ